MGLRTALLWAAVLAIGGCTGAIEGDKTSALNRHLSGEGYLSLESCGWIKAWQGLSAVRAKAVITIHQPGGQAYVNTVDLTMDLPGGTLEAQGRTATGAWQGRAGIDGKSTLSGEGLPGEPARQQEIAQALTTILHRLRGPVNLLQGTERLGSLVSGATVDGVGVIRRPVTQRGAVDVKAYYFSKADHRLAFLTTGGDAPGQPGEVTVYEYETLKSGLAFPREIRLVRIGSNVLLGKEVADLLLEATFSDVRL